MGRPRNIPESEAIDRALRVFWMQGYDRASVADLAAALEVGPSSLYNAFGNKEQLYRRAIEHYVARYTGFIGEAEEADLDVETSVAGLLRAAAMVYTDPNTPPGCAVMQTGGASSPEESRAAAITLEVKAAVEQRLKRMLDRASRAHGTELAAPSRILAKYLIGTLRGLSQLAIDGLGRKDLVRVGDVAARGCVASGSADRT